MATPAASSPTNGTGNPHPSTSLSPDSTPVETVQESMFAYSTPYPPQSREQSQANPRSRAEKFGEILWAIFDVVVLFRMGSIYLHRFEDFEGCHHPEHSDEREREVTLWRKEQQKEWDRLSTTVNHLFGLVLWNGALIVQSPLLQMALLGTMNAGILKVPKEGYTGLPGSLWLGAAGMKALGTNTFIDIHSLRIACRVELMWRFLNDVLFSESTRSTSHITSPNL